MQHGMEGSFFDSEEIRLLDSFGCLFLGKTRPSAVAVSESNYRASVRPCTPTSGSMHKNACYFLTHIYGTGRPAVDR